MKSFSHFYLILTTIILTLSSFYCWSSNRTLYSNPLLDLIKNELEQAAEIKNNIFYINSAILEVNKSLVEKFEKFETKVDDLIATLRFLGISRRNPKFNFTNGLIHYWPFNANVLDVIRGANLYGVVNSGFSRDRLGSYTGALALYNGYYQAPSGVYFEENFTITAWVRLRSFRHSQRLIDFGNGPANNNIICMIDSANNCGKPSIMVYNGKNGKEIESLVSIRIGEWNHLACMFKNGIGYIYINGTNTALGPTNKPVSTLRLSNYVGRSNWRSQFQNQLYELDSNADIDDLKIFNRALSESEIKFEMNNTFFL